MHHTWEDVHGWVMCKGEKLRAMPAARKDV